MKYFTTILLLSIAGLALMRPARGQAYCNVREVKTTTLANGVQILIKADGILTWDWEADSRKAGWGEQVTSAAIRLPGCRLGLDKTLYDINQNPVSTFMLTIPQDVKNGLGVVGRVTMTQPSNIEVTLSEDRQTLLLTVKGQRTVEGAGHAAAGGEVRKGLLQVTVHDRLVSVQAVKADIHKVVAEIAEQSGIGAAVDDAVQREVSLNLQDKAPLDVLKGIAAGYGLALSPVGDVYMLSEGVPADLSTYQRSGTSAFALKYLKAGDAKSLLPSFLFKYVHENSEQNAVVVTAPSQMLEKIGQDLHSIDVPPPMILVECAVVELAKSASLDKAFRWRYQSPEFDFGSDTTTGVADYRHLDISGGLATAIVPTPQLQAIIQRLITIGQARVEAHPSMAAVNGKYAEIFIGSQRFIKVESVVNGVTQERLETVPVGVRLNVRPLTGGNQEITTWLKVEVSNIVQIDPQSGVPLLGTRRSETTMRIHDGETIILGGLSLAQEDQTRRKTPLLGDLPLLGSLFRGTAKSSSNTELILLVRPRLLDETGHLPPAEDRQFRQQFLLPGDPGFLSGDRPAAGQ